MIYKHINGALNTISPNSPVFQIGVATGTQLYAVNKKPTLRWINKPKVKESEQIRLQIGGQRDGLTYKGTCCQAWVQSPQPTWWRERTNSWAVLWPPHKDRGKCAHPRLHTCIYTILKRLKCDRKGSLIACAISNEVDYTTRMKTRDGEAAGHPDGTIKHTWI